MPQAGRLLLNLHAITSTSIPDSYLQTNNLLGSQGNWQTNKDAVDGGKQAGNADDAVDGDENTGSKTLDGED